MTLDTYLLYLGTVLVFFAHPPGPSQLLFISGSLRHGPLRALPIMVGDLSANALQILAAGFGLASLVALSGATFTLIKWLGVAYLVWIGLRMILEASRKSTQKAPPPPAALFRKGFLTSAANPYAILFFAALFPQFITPTVAILPQVLILGAIYLVIDGVILLIMGRLAHSLTRALGGRAERWLLGLSGTSLIIVAGLIGLRDLPEPQQ